MSAPSEKKKDENKNNNNNNNNNYSNSEQKSIEAQIESLKLQLNALQNQSKNQNKNKNKKLSSSQASEILGDIKQNNNCDEQTLIVVANRLPVSIQRINNEYIFKPSSGGLVTALKQLGNLNVKWVGCLGYIELSKREYISLELLKYNVYLVRMYLEKKER